MNRGLAALVLALPVSAWAQSPSPPLQQRPAQVPMDPAQAQSFDAQQAAFSDYQSCVAAHRPEVDLHNATRQLIQFRDHPSMLEGALQDPAARERAPGGAAGVMQQQFAQYKALGGTAATIAEVTEVPTPCPPPSLDAVRKAPRGGSSPISASRQISR